jgi:hypothetical protein
MVTVDGNAFDALCELAAMENWCWRIPCTTCGHLYFRYGFRELVRGKHPQSSDWRAGKAHHHRLAHDLGPMPSLGSWSIAEQRALASVLQEASLKDIASHAHFPDWLGYLGLGLLYTEGIEREERILTSAWIPQFLDLLPPNAPLRSHLERIHDEPTGILRWRYLEQIESDLRR